MATQKGLDLLAQAFDHLVQENIFLVVLGTGEPYYENLLRGWQERFPLKVAVTITYDETLAHKVEAGSDMVLMPSRSEPCGLNQIYGMKYGTVPVVRATGGLDDTVQEWSAADGTGTGFRFQDYRPEALLQAVRAAAGCVCRQATVAEPDAERHGARLFLDQPGQGVHPAL